MEKELILIVGLPWSGKIAHAEKHYINHQLICPFSIKEAMEKKRVNSLDAVYLVIEMMARSLMRFRRPIVVTEDSTQMESIFIWKQLAIEYEYTMKAIMIDTPLEKCFSDAKKQDKAVLKILSDKSKQYEELKQILYMKNQTMIDEVIVVNTEDDLKLEDKADEIL